MGVFDKHLERVSVPISIKKEDRENCTKDFDCIRDFVLRSMRKYDSDFDEIFKGPSLFGSYQNNVRIFYPSEFDVHMKLLFPYSNLIKVKEDKHRPGFVNLNFSRVMKKLEKENNSDDMYDLLDELLDDSYNFLLRTKLRNWICNIIHGALNEYGNKVYGECGDIFELEYSERGLAHTIYARGPNYNISIDFVPAVVFGRREWMTIPTEHHFKKKCNEWYAVPKPSPGPKSSRRFAFMICNPKAEHNLLLKKQNLKIVFRLLKSLNAEYQMRRLKSYFITTAFLWEIRKRSEKFWYKPIGYIFIHMLDVLRNYFLKSNLPFFWNADLNLLDNLYDEEIETYASTLSSLYNTFKSYPHQPQLSYKRVLSHFKLPKERMSSN